MRIILSYLKDHIKVIIVYLLFVSIFYAIFYLYNLQLEPVMYASTLCGVLGSIFIILDILKYRKKNSVLQNLRESIIYSIDNLPEVNGLIEEDYNMLINILFEEKAKVLAKVDMDMNEMIDYYTLWAHQIKTPIAAMRILIQSVEDDNNSYLLNELFKIEQYVEMVLGYLRMESMSSDLVLQSYSLDDIVRQVVRKYARLFIAKKIKLDFKELNTQVLTDEKWLVFVIEQIISNAIKYSKIEGTISIYMDKNKSKTLVIEDSGIGIEKEDLPRVFEKGFTGFNGRSDKKSTGIGLYLCKTILNKLSHKIEIESEVSKFTRVKIGLDTIKL